MTLLTILVCAVALMFVLVKSGASFSFQSGGGTSFSASGLNLKIKGKVASVTYNKELLFGSLDAKPTNSNSISQSNNDYSLKIKGGHVDISGSIHSLKLNNKKII